MDAEVWKVAQARQSLFWARNMGKMRKADWEAAEATGAPFASLDKRTQNTVYRWLQGRTKRFDAPDKGLPVEEWLEAASALIEAARTPCPVCSTCPVHGQVL